MGDFVSAYAVELFVLFERAYAILDGWLAGQPASQPAPGGIWKVSRTRKSMETIVIPWRLQESRKPIDSFDFRASPNILHGDKNIVSAYAHLWFMGYVFYIFQSERTKSWRPPKTARTLNYNKNSRALIH